jgi:hypothetical protein
MKIKIAFATVLLLSVAGLAQSSAYIEQEAQSLAYDLQREGRYLSEGQRMQIARNLESIRRIMAGDVGHPNPPPSYGNYTCVSRDNDGRNPYVLGYRQGVNVTRISGETFNTNQECSVAISQSRQLQGRTVMCVSRDNDGRNPYQLAVLNGTQISRVQRTMVNSKDECLSLLQTLRPRREGMTFCTSRDNDGRNPYVAAILNLSSNSVQVGTETFSDKASCERFLGQ